MTKVIFLTLVLVVTFVTAQRQSVTRTTRRGTSTTTTQSPDYNDYGDQTSSVATTQSTTRANARAATRSKAFQAKVNVRPVTNQSPKPAVAAGVRTSSSSSAGNKVAVLSSQNQDPWVALENIRGRSTLSSEEILEIMLSANPGVDFPLLSQVPEPVKFQCENQKQPGFYADPDFKCQVFRRCDPNGNIFGFLCPNTTIFNQVSLTCDWWFNVDCAKAVGFYDFSNARLYHENWPLLGSISAN